MVSIERKPSLSRGEKINRRRVLAEERKNASWSDESQRARMKLRELETKLSSEEGIMEPLERASLEVERIWWKFKAGEISSEGREKEFNETLKRWEESNQKVFIELTKENGDGITRLAKIRDKVIPPLTIGGYHTKRRF